MSQTALPSIAPLRNVALLDDLVEHLVKRQPNLPGIGVFSGRAGVGKSSACAHACVAHSAVYLEIRDHFTRKALFQAMLKELAIIPERTAALMFDQVCEQLTKSRRPVILDMGDYLIKRHLIDTVLDLYEGSKCAFVMVGEELFPKKLLRESERVYDRVLDWVPAELANLADARKLAALYAPEVAIKDDLLAEIVKASKGIARRIAVNIEAVRVAAKKTGKRALSLEDWGGQQFSTGDAPVRRVA